MTFDIKLSSLAVATAIGALVAASAIAQDTPAEPDAMAEETMFDTDRGVMLADSDGDGFPDMTESLEGTNPFNEANFPGSDIPSDGEMAEMDMAEGEDAAADVGFPASSCRSGYRQAGSRLCISTNVHDARSFANASTFCRDRRGRVAGYGDLRYLYVRTTIDSAYNPNGRWLGDWTGDDQVLCGNKSVTFNNDPDIANFDGTCNRFDNRNFWCAHDLQ